MDPLDPAENSQSLQNIIKIKVFGTLDSKTLSNYIETHKLGRGDSPTLVFYNENATFTLPDRPPAPSLQPLGSAGLFLPRKKLTGLVFATEKANGPRFCHAKS